ncbi:MAG: 4Fe-4S binding protein [Candidatus Heimdallarchaeota archaeon]
MFLQIEPLPFIYTFAVPVFFFWVLISIITMLLMDMKMLNKKTTILIYVINILFSGVLFGGFPNALMPIQQVLIIIGGRGIISSLLPVLIILGLLLASSFMVGRIFCGFACPLGALQELLSKIKFKSDLGTQKRVKSRIKVSNKIISIVRWSFFSLIFLLAGVWSVAILQEFNPILGFYFYNTPLSITLIPLISLIFVIIVSIFIYRPWCRLLCPFGTGSSLCGRFSRINYHRTKNCTECGLCEKVCPTNEAFRGIKKGECYYCNRCIDICPNDAIKFME